MPIVSAILSQYPGSALMTTFASVPVLHVDRAEEPMHGTVPASRPIMGKLLDSAGPFWQIREAETGLVGFIHGGPFQYG
jgi:hypothetical protein